MQWVSLRLRPVVQQMLTALIKPDQVGYMAKTKPVHDACPMHLDLTRCRGVSICN